MLRMEIYKQWKGNINKNIKVHPKQQILIISLVTDDYRGGIPKNLGTESL